MHYNILAADVNIFECNKLFDPTSSIEVLYYLESREQILGLEGIQKPNSK